MKLKNIKCLLAVCLCASALLVGCGQKTADKSETSSESAQNQSEDIQEASRDVFAMDTYMTVTAYGENAEAAVDAAQAEIERLDALLSTGNADSEIAKLNADGSAELSEDAGYLTERALELYQETDGAFDIAQHRTSRFRHRRHWISFFHSLMREIFLMTKKRERYLSV